MLHPIKPAAEVELRNIIAFQRKVLEFACLPTLNFDHDQVDAFFGIQSNWFWAHTSLHSLVKNLGARIDSINDPNLGSLILAAFDNDVGFDKRIDDPTFAFACCQLNIHVKALVSALLKAFYDLLEGGYSQEITGIGKIDRDDVVQGFWSVNHELKVCPYCDGLRPDKTDGKVRAHCDHHFPKSKHPALSVHPRNLVPSCLDCNTTFKGDKDATDKAHISELFLPYADGHVAFGPLKISAFRDAGELTVRFDDNGSPRTSRIESLNHLLKLQDRWIDRLKNRVSGSIVNSLRNQYRSANRRNEKDADILENLGYQKDGCFESRGKEHDSILKETYFDFLINDSSERNDVFSNFGIAI